MKQINALADYAKHISSELVLFDRALLRQCLLNVIFFVAVVVCLFVVAVAIIIIFLIGIN